MTEERCWIQKADKDDGLLQSLRLSLDKVLEHFWSLIQKRDLCLYHIISSCVIVPDGTSPGFKANVGISPYGFMLVTKMLAIHLQKFNNIKKIKCFSHRYYHKSTDDTAIF